MEGVAGSRGNGSGERAGHHQFAGIETLAKRSEPIGEPGDAVGRVVQHGRGDAGFLQYAVSIAERTDPAQVDVERAYRATANYQCRVGRVVRDGVDHAPRRPGLGIVASGAQIHDLQRGNYILGRIENLEDRAVGSFERLAQDKSKFVLEHRRNEAMGRYLRAVLIKHVVEQHAVIGFLDVEHRLHGPRGKADLVPDNFTTLGKLEIDPCFLHRVPVGIGDFGILGGRKPDNLPGLFGFVKLSGQSRDSRNVHYSSDFQWNLAASSAKLSKTGSAFSGPVLGTNVSTS